MYTDFVWTTMAVVVAVGFVVLIAAFVGAVAESRRRICQPQPTVRSLRTGSPVTQAGRRAA